MSLFSITAQNQGKKLRISLAVAGFFLLSACQFQPLHGNSSNSLATGTSELAAVGVSSVSTRVGQQVRNHLIFLFTGGNPTPEKTHEIKIRVSSSNAVLSAIADPSVRDTTAGTVTVTVSYDLIDNATGESVKTGSRFGKASYDRGGQVFANQRAVRDAENRAAREAAEALRLVIASDLQRI